MNKMMVPVGMLICAIILCIAGFTSSNQEAFLFPNVVAVIMVVIAALALFNSKNTQTKQSKNAIPWALILPAIVVFIVYIALVESVGFYTCSFFAFLALVCFYMPEKLTVNRFIRILMTDVVFMTGLYCLFSLLLRVQLPRGMFL